MHFNIFDSNLGTIINTMHMMVFPSMRSQGINNTIISSIQGHQYISQMDPVMILGFSNYIHIYLSLQIQ